MAYYKQGYISLKWRNHKECIWNDASVLENLLFTFSDNDAKHSIEITSRYLSFQQVHVAHPVAFCLFLTISSLDTKRIWLSQA